MKKIFVMMMFVAICVYVSMSSLNVDVNADSKCEVIFRFDGLQAIAFGDTSRVSDGIMDVHHHQPNIKIEQVQQKKKLTLYNVTADELKSKVLTVNVPNKQLKPSRYYSVDMNKDKQDFRWCLDLEQDVFQKQLYLKEEMFFCKIHFLTGQFVTDHVSDEIYQFVAGSKIHPIKRPIGMASNHIQLQKGDNLTITGLDKNIALPYSPDTVYEIDVTNLPPTDMMNVDHFGFYYDVIKADVPKFMPVLVKKASFMPRPMVCESVIFGKSTIK